EPDNPLGIGWRDAAAGILKPSRKTVDPQPAVRVEHHLHDRGIFEVAADGAAERGAEHSRAAFEGLRSESDCAHAEPRGSPRLEADVSTGSSRKSLECA